jgi:triosephosphate isomerase
MTTHAGARPLAAVSLKAYLGQRATTDWLAAVRDAVVAHPDVEVAVFPLLTAVPEAVRLLGDVATVGTQHVSTAPAGAFTGEVPAAVLAELGVRYAEIGHAERRRHFGEDDALFRRQVAAAREAGLEPLVCVGEPRRGPAADAVATCVERLGRILPDDGAAGTPAVVAYEPEWAIGAAEPAPAEHVVAVLQGLRRWAGDTGRTVRLVYGGTAGPGTYARLTPAADGLFLGRRAHDPAALADVLREMSATSTVGATKEISHEHH